MGSRDVRAGVYEALDEALCPDQRIFDDTDLSEPRYDMQFVDELHIDFKLRQSLGVTLVDFRAKFRAPLEAAKPPYRSMPVTPARIIELVERESR